MYISVNESRSWIFLGIRYRNSGFRVHETERHDLRYIWPCCIPFPLWQRTSYVHQDHPVSGVLTSFVLPIHNQGVSYAPKRGHCPLDKIPADYWLILCFLITDSLPVTALFPVDVTCYIQFCSAAVLKQPYSIVTMQPADWSSVV